MTQTMTRRDLLRRGAALAGGLLASQAFVFPLQAAPADALSARLQLGYAHAGEPDTVTLELALMMRNASPETLSIDHPEVTLAMRLADDPNAPAHPLELINRSHMVRSMPETRVDLVAGQEMEAGGFIAYLTPASAPLAAWSGRLLYGEPSVSVLLGESRRVVPCAPFELQLPAV